MDADLWTARAACVVIPVNCVGVMGAGLAKQARDRYPKLYDAYARECRAGHLAPGRVLIFINSGKTLGCTDEPSYIACFPTKRHWRDKSYIDDIAAGLPELVNHLKARMLPSVAIPALGCGLGGLDWDDVRPMILGAFAEYPDIELKIFPPIGY